MPNNNPIGIFDSGIGGLTVLKELSMLLPAEDIIYLGDTARVPYGIRSPETVIRYSFECTEFLMKQNIKILVVACNTASAVSLNELTKRIEVPIIGVIEPGAMAAVRSTRNKKIGVIGTEATIRSNAYQKAMNLIDNRIEISSMACPLFVPLVEEGWTDGIVTELVAERYLSGLRNKGVDTVVLGCTHYPLLRNVIQTVMGNEVVLIDSAIETAKVVNNVLSEKGLLKVDEGLHSIRFFVTDSPDRFISVGERFLQKRIINIEKISL